MGCFFWALTDKFFSKSTSKIVRSMERINKFGNPPALPGDTYCVWFFGGWE